LTHENVNTTTGRDGPTLSGQTWPSSARPDDISFRSRPGPLQFVNFSARPGQYGLGRAYGPPGLCRALLCTTCTHWIKFAHTNNKPDNAMQILPLGEQLIRTLVTELVQQHIIAK